MFGDSDPMSWDFRVDFSCVVPALVATICRRRPVWPGPGPGPNSTVGSEHASHGERGVGPADQQACPVRHVLVQVHGLQREVIRVPAERGKRIKCSRIATICRGGEEGGG